MTPLSRGNSNWDVWMGAQLGLILGQYIHEDTQMDWETRLHNLFLIVMYPQDLVIRNFRDQ